MATTQDVLNKLAALDTKLSRVDTNVTALQKSVATLQPAPTPTTTPTTPTPTPTPTTTQPAPTQPAPGTRVAFVDCSTIAPTLTALSGVRINPYVGNQYSASLLSADTQRTYNGKPTWRSRFPINQSVITDLQWSYPTALGSHATRVLARYEPGYTTIGSSGDAQANALKVMGHGFTRDPGRTTLEITQTNQYQVYMDGQVPVMNSWDANQGEQRCAVGTEWTDGAWWWYELASIFESATVLRVEFRRWKDGTTRPASPLLTARSTNATAIPQFNRAQLFFFMNETRTQETGVNFAALELVTL